jgi:hypothetical protein
MEVTFGKDQQPVPAATETAAPSPTPAPSPSALPAVQGQRALGAPAGLVLGDKIPDFSEIILPRVNIVQNIGKLKESFIPGSLVFNQETVLFVPPYVNEKDPTKNRAATPPVTLTVLGFRPTRYCEKIEGGAQGRILNNEADVRAAGGTLDYAEWQLKKAAGMKRFEPLADALVAVERPSINPQTGQPFPETDGEDPTFGYSVDGKRLALGLWALRGTSYTAAAKRVFFTARAVGCLRGGYPTWLYTVVTREETYPGGNKAWIPVCLPKAKQTPKFLEFVQQVLSAPQVEAEPAQS